MAKKIRFKLEMPDGTHVGSIDELKEHFDLEAVISYFRNGKLLTWLQDRYIEDEANAVSELSESAPDFQRRLCEIFGINFSGENVDMETFEIRQARREKLLSFTDEEEFLKNIDSVAFDQEELADLLDEGCDKIYLCGDRFTIPASQKNKTYVGVNQPKVHIGGKAAESWEELGIAVLNCDVENPPAFPQDTCRCIENYDTLNVDDIPENVADQIFHSLVPTPWYYEVIETKGWFLPEPEIVGSSGIYVVDKRTGDKTVLLSESEYPHKCLRDFDKWSCIENSVIVFFSENSVGNAEVYKIDVPSKQITSLDFRLEPYELCGTNGRYFCMSSSSSTGCVCIDLMARKKYQLQHEPYGKVILFTDKALYFVSCSSSGGEVIEFLLNGKKERVIANIPTANCEALSYYDNKIFLCLDLNYRDYPASNYHFGYIDLSSPVPHQYHSVQEGLRIYNDSLKKYTDGWAFVADKHKWNLQYFDFKTMNLTTLATDCGYRDWYKGGLFERSEWLYHANPFLRIGNWMYYCQGDDKTNAKVSIDRPMSIELLGEDL